MNNAPHLKAAVAGIGFIGPVHIESLRRIPGVQVVAIVHSNEERAAEKAGQLAIPAYYTSFSKMLAVEKPDAVHICTPNHLHYVMVKEALLNNIHVVCEKPLTLSLSEAQELVSLATAKNLVHAVNFNIRYYPLIRHIKSACANNEAGKLFSINGSYQQDWLLKDTDYNWRLETDKSGMSKAFADIGSHLLDLIEYSTGLQITEVMADFSTAYTKRKKPLENIETYSGKMATAKDFEEVVIHTEDTANVLLRFSNGTKGIATVSQVAAGRKNRLQLEINGASQSFAWCSETPNELWIGKRDAANQILLKDPSLVHESARSIIGYPGGHNEGFADTTKQLFNEVYTAIKNPGLRVNPLYPTFKNGIREMELCEKIIESHQRQCWIKI